MSKLSISLYLFLAVIAGVSSCSKQRLTVNDYLIWVDNPENKLIQDRQIKGINYSAKYLPTEYVVIKDYDGHPEKEELLLGIEDRDALQYFNFRISGREGDILKYNITDPSEEALRINYFSFHIKNDLTLIENGKSIPCKLCVFARNYHLSPSLEFAIAFENSGNSSGDKIVQYNDRVFGNGPVNILIPGSAIDEIPLLEI